MDGNEILLSHINAVYAKLRYYSTFFSRYYGTYSNYIEVLWHRVFNRFPTQGVLRNRKRIVLSDKFVAWTYTILYKKFRDFDVHDDFLEFEYDGRRIRFHGWRYGDVVSAFVTEDYSFLDVKDKVVIDIGASIGDTPIYFALKGARKVIAFEPFPKIFSLTKKNVEENKLQDRIILVNAGCGYDGKVKIREDTESNVGTQLIDQGEGMEIPVYSLNTIVKKFDVENAVLKVDCEGCEYDLFRTASNETLEKFDQIMIEYHHGYKDIEKRLKEANFKVKHTLPRHTKGGLILGYIYAWR